MRQAKRRSPQPASVGVRAGHDLHAVAILDVVVRVLDEHAAEDAPVVALPGRRAAALGLLEDPHGRLPRGARQAPPRVPGRDQDLDELLCERAGERLV